MGKYTFSKKANRLRLTSLFLVVALFLQFTYPIFSQTETTGIASKSILSKGMEEFKDSFSGVGTPSWILQKFGIQMGYHLIDCATKKEKPDVVKVVKSMATADYLSRVAGGVIGGAAGSIFVPFLASVPIFGGFLADFVPTFGCYLGANFAGEGIAGLKNGKFNFKNYFKKLDWTAMLAGSVGWSVGSLLCSAIIPPIGGIVGGMLGDLIATKLVDKYRQWRGKSDSSPPLMPTGVGGPIRHSPNRPTKSAYSPKASVSNDSLLDGKASAADAEKLMALSADYERLYKEYNRIVPDEDPAEIQRIGKKLNEIKIEIEKARGK